MRPKRLQITGRCRKVCATAGTSCSPVCVALQRKLSEISDDDICTMSPEVDGMVTSSDADYETESSGTARFHSAEGVLEGGGAKRWAPQSAGRFQVHIRRRLTA